VESQQSSPAKVPVREVAAKAGSSANFTCGSNGLPIFICLWERVSDKKFSINIVDAKAVSGESLVPGYSYTGPGFSTGNCGLQIQNVKDEDNAIWNCKLFTQQGHLFEGNVRVGILSKELNLYISSIIKFKLPQNHSTCYILFNSGCFLRIISAGECMTTFHLNIQSRIGMRIGMFF